MNVSDRLTALAALSALAALALIAAAFAIPTICCADETMGLSGDSVRQLKTDARHASDLPPLKMQVIVHEPSASLESTRASIIWRTAFGFEAGRSEFNGQASDTRLEFWDYMWPWILLGGATVILLTPAGLLIRREYVT